MKDRDKTEDIFSPSKTMDRYIYEKRTQHRGLDRRRSQRPYSHLSSSSSFSSSSSLLFLQAFFIFSIAPQICHAQCTNSSGCFPPIGNLALGRTISTDSQCSAGDIFCISAQGTSDCTNACNPSVHSISSINDGNNGTAWISSIGLTNATLQLDFEEPVLFEEMNMLWKSSRPRSMILERSQDGGLNWEIYRYYSSSCLADFGLVHMNTLSLTEPFPNTAAICTQSQSAISPNTNGLVTFSTSEHLPPDISTTTSNNYKTITNLRVVLLDQFAFGSDDRFQYYSVGEWVVRGTCLCNGHASVCAPAPGESLASEKVYSGCMCDHNTDGTHCETCQTGFNAIQWSPGTDTEANECEQCECNGHAEDCTSENLEQGVLCIDCQHNTVGDSCEACQSGYYQNSSLLYSDPDICIACECDSGGIVDSGACSKSGQCNCKTHVTGQQCTQCLDGYWNFTASNVLGCQECECDLRGTVTSGGNLPICDQLTGVCQCIENVRGDSCNMCDDEYYSLEDGCIPCDCNIAGSTGLVCDKDSPDGQCPCLPNIDTPTCTTPFSGYYFRHLDHLLFEAEEASLTEEFTLVYPGPQSPIQYSGRGLVLFPPFGIATFTVTVPRDYSYEMILRIQATSEELLTIEIESISPVTTGLNCATISEGITTNTNFITISGDHVVIESPHCFVAGVPYTVRLESLNVQNSPWMLDSLVLLPHFESGSAYYAQVVAATRNSGLLEDCIPRSLALSGPREECQDIAFALSVEFFGQVFECDCTDSVGSDGDAVCERFGGQCSCLDGVAGLLCDRCSNGWFNLTSAGCELCGCDAEGSISSVCDLQTGQCDCQPNVQGLNCDSCYPGYFNLTSTGCSDCSCSQFSSSDQCSETGQCPCLGGVGGLTCNECIPGFYNMTSDGCTTCDCNSVGERSSSNECDIETGQCPCISNTVGRDCSQCPETHYEARNLLMDICIECVCSLKTTDCTDGSDEFLAAAWVSDFQKLCREDPVTCNDDWELLTSSGVSAGPFGPSDATGLGYIILSNNNPMLYAPPRFLGDKQSSYGLELLMVVSLSTTAGLKDTTSVVLESGGEDPLRLVGVFPPPSTQQEPLSLNTILTYTIPLVEDYWHVESPTGPTATFFQLKSLLSNITQLSFSAEFREDFIEFVYVQRIQFPTRVPRELDVEEEDLVYLNITFPAELCNCPAEYAGSSCQYCARGHARPSGDLSDPCVKCDCNNLSLDCDVDTAVCTNCTGNSEGDHCERCQTGYYGDPTRGIPCLPCHCPSSERSFSPSCFLDSDLNSTCDNCSRGYSGRNCEICADGYYGNPLVGQCITCECNGNVDSALGPVCDMISGRCLNCLNNTEGFECEFCKPGFYGDPPSGVPCAPCQCHPNGTVGDCSRLFGTCTCANENVLGEFCNECQDGFWGLSRGLPCVTCDCCSSGSISDICDKDTGRCDCLDNVGSELDDKCCTCTPGYFDFTSTGCRECGCSPLSVSEECHIATGQCQCEEGAIGLKCDSCDFGFTGSVPNCTECHPCFHQWYDRIESLSEMVAILQRRASFLVDEYYNGYTVESIEADIQELLDELASTNATLQNITLDPSSLQQLHDILQEVNDTLEEMDELTRDTEQQLIMAGQMLETTGAFDGTVNGTTVNELVQQIRYYNTTISNLVYGARDLLIELERDKLIAEMVWANISAIETSVQESLEESTSAISNLDQVESLLHYLDQERESLRQNLTHISIMAMNIITELTNINASLVNVSTDSSETVISGQELSNSVMELRSQADRVLYLSRQLNTSIETIQYLADHLIENTTSLLGHLIATVEAAQTVSEQIGTELLHVVELTARLYSIKNDTRIVFDTVLPNLDYVEELAMSISSSVIPEDQVAEIVANATASQQIAQLALELAQNASNTVRVTQDLINQLKYDLNSTETTQSTIQETLSLIESIIDSFRYQLQEVRVRAAEVNATYRQVQEVVEDTSETVISNTQLAFGLQNRSHELIHQANSNNNRSLGYQNDAEELIEEFSELKSETDYKLQESVEILENATSVLSSVQQLSNTASQLPLQQLQQLLMEYANERELIRDLRENVARLRSELQNLTSTFMQAAQDLNNCYKTP